MIKHGFFSRILSVVAATLLLAPAWLTGQEAPTLPEPGTPSVNRQQQEQLGLKAMGEVYNQMPVLPDSSPITRYVQELGKRLVSVIPQESSWPYQFHVVQQKDINAFALPGGPIFINLGTIQAAQNEAELAGVMSHEMSHIYMQHTAKSLPKQQFAQIFAGVLGAVLPGSTAGNLARLGIQFGAGTVLLKYSRADEAQADAVGAVIMYKAGYNPHALATFFQRLEQQGGNGVQFLSNHPNPGNREEAITREVSNWPERNFLGDSRGFVSAKQEAGRAKTYSAQEIADGAKQGIWLRYNQQNGSIPKSLSSTQPGDQGASGALQNVAFRDVQPSERLRTLDQNGFRISYPENWQVRNGNSGVTIAPAAGASGDSVAYGVIIGTAQNSGAQSLDQATDNLVQGLQQSNTGLQRSGGSSRIDVNGLEARSVYLTGNSPLQKGGQSLQERDWLVVVPGQQGLLYLIFVAPEHDFGQLRPAFEKMLNSLQVQ